MPQFDQSSFFNQVSWFFTFFFSFYFLISYFFLPVLIHNIKFRKKKINKNINKNIVINFEKNNKLLKLNNLYKNFYLHLNTFLNKTNELNYIDNNLNKKAFFNKNNANKIIVPFFTKYFVYPKKYKLSV